MLIEQVTRAQRKPGITDAAVSSFCAVQLTDSHFRADAKARMAGHEIDATLSTVLDELERQGVLPDLVLLTGDLADDPDIETFPAIYARLIELVRQRFDKETKICAVPGNHDIGASFQSSFARSGIQTSGSFTMGNWQFCLLDSSVPGSNGGSLSPSQLDSVAAVASQNPGDHVTVILHHPPISLDSSWMDTMMVDNADALFATIGNFNNIRVCIWGHAHQEWDSLFNGVRQLGSPASCPVQFKPRASEYSIDEEQAPGCRCITFHPDGNIDTRIIRIRAQE